MDDVNIKSVLSNIDMEIISPKRLMLLTVLYVSGPKTEGELHRMLGISWGDLDSNIRRLMKKGYVEKRRKLTPMGPRTVIILTEDGVNAYRKQSTVLKNILMRVEEIKTIETKIEEIYVIHRDGRLMAHLSCEDKKKDDSEVIGGMFTAVQKFMDEVFRDRGGLMTRMDFGYFSIILSWGKFINIVSVVSGENLDSAENKVKKFIESSERKYEEILNFWDGDKSRIKWIEEEGKMLLGNI